MEESFDSDEQVIADIENIINNSDYDEVGIRVEDVDTPLGVGDDLPPSRVWIDGELTDELLDGTSTYGVNGSGGVGRALKDMGLSRERGEHGYYGNVIYLVAGDRASVGEDFGERVIKDAKVIAVYIREKPAFAPIDWRLEGGTQQ